MLALLARWVLNAAALLLVAYLYPGVQVETFLAAVIAALVLGLVNAIVRPILVLLTLPATILTLGLFPLAEVLIFHGVPWRSLVVLAPAATSAGSDVRRPSHTTTWPVAFVQW